MAYSIVYSEDAKRELRRRRLHVLGTLRVVYRVDHRARLIDVVKIGGRGSIYED